MTNGSGGSVGINRYAAYGVTAGGNVGRFQYTGQMWLPEVGLYYYKARMYSPSLGRFMQTDPIGYGDGMNWYAYVGNDPVNKTDPSGHCSIVQKGYAYFTPSGNQFSKDFITSTEFVGCDTPMLTQWWGPVLGSRPPVTVRPRLGELVKPDFKTLGDLFKGGRIPSKQATLPR